MRLQLSLKHISTYLGYRGDYHQSRSEPRRHITIHVSASNGVRLGTIHYLEKTPKIKGKKGLDDKGKSTYFPLPSSARAKPTIDPNDPIYVECT